MNSEELPELGQSDDKAEEARLKGLVAQLKLKGWQVCCYPSSSRSGELTQKDVQLLELRSAFGVFSLDSFAT